MSGREKASFARAKGRVIGEVESRSRIKGWFKIWVESCIESRVKRQVKSKAKKADTNKAKSMSKNEAKKNARSRVASRVCAAIFAALIFLSCFYGHFEISGEFCFNTCVAADEESLDEDTTTLVEQLEEEVSTQLSNLDFSSIEQIVSSLSTSAKTLFSANSFTEKVKMVISGTYSEDSESFFSSVISLLFSNLKEFLPLLAVIISISILSGMVGNLKPSSGGKSIGNIVHFVTYGLVIVVLGSTLVSLISSTTQTLTQVKGMFDAIFPILLTLLTAVGGTTSVAVYQPTIAILSEVITSFFTYVLLPMFVFSVVFSIVGNLSNNLKLGHFVSFLQGAFKWTVGMCFTIFLGFVSIQAVTAGSVDGLSIKAAKYAIKSYVPIVGGYVSDGMSIITASTTLIKNAVGGVGLFLLLSTMIGPLLNLVIFMLALKFMAGVIEPIGDAKTATFISDLSKSMTLLIALLFAVAFMYLVLTGLIMMSTNLLW